MKRILTIAAFLAFAFPLMAQFGISVAYKTINASGWERTIDNISSNNGEVELPIERGFSVGLDYWFRLKDKRIEFLPELNYSSFSKNWSNSEGNTGKISSNFYSLYFNTNFYIFDLAGDCDCPTFSKDGDIMKKGFFVQVSPGVSFLQNKYSNLVDNTEQGNNPIAPSIGLGVGLDIGFSDFFTITPMVAYRHHFGVEWENFHSNFEGNALSASDNTNSISTIHFGVRLGVRLDEQ